MEAILKAKSKPKIPPTPIMSSYDMIIKARSELVQIQTFFGYLAMSLQLMEDPGCKTGWTDGKYLAWNPLYIPTLDPSCRRTFVAHEVVHCAGGDQWRRGTRDKKLWNRAADHVRNLQLKDAGFKPIPGWLCDERFRGMSVEKVYAILLQRQIDKDKEEKENQQSNQQQDDKHEAEDNPQANPTQEPDENEDGNEDAASADEDDQQDGGEKSNSESEDSKEDGDEDSSQTGPGKSTGNSKANTEENNDGSGTESIDSPSTGSPGGDQGVEEEAWDNPCGEVRDAAQEPDTKTETEWAMAAIRAEAAAKAAGKCGAGIEEFVSQLKDPVEDWRAVLHRFAQEHARSDYNFQRPNKRFAAAGVYAPVLKSKQMGKLIFLRDVSGSVSRMEDAACCSEIVSAIDECHPLEAHIIQFDARTKENDPSSVIRDHIILEKGDDIPEMKRMGSGGTEFRPAFDYIEQQEIDPVCVIVCTDLYPCDGFPEEPSYPVLWVSTSNQTAPWGEVVYILDGGA